MKSLVIKNFGALKDVDISLNRVNVIIGPQSLGKSTILKIASYCTWVEKRIELTQNYSNFANGDTFIRELIEFHKLNGYIKPDTYIEYTTDYMHFSYTHANKEFQFQWTNHRWEYRRPKVSYIPSERNLVAAIPNWYEVSMGRNNIRSFMADWETARQSVVDNINILDLDVKYRFESEGKRDKVLSHNTSSLDFTNTSSGLQSLIPLFVHLSYLYKTQYQVEKDKKIQEDWENEQLLQAINQELSKSTLSPQERHTLYKQYLMTDHCEVFVEEPENNLFPPTQDSLVKWLLDKTLDSHANFLFIATHSPYVLSSILEEKNIPISLFLVYEEDEFSKVKSASKEELQGIYDYGIDAFFNLSNLITE